MSSTEVERKCVELMRVRDGITKAARESEVTDASEMEKALPDSANTRKVKGKGMESTRVKETRTVLDRLMGGRAQLPSGSETVVSDNSEGTALSSSALDSACFPAPE